MTAQLPKLFRVTENFEGRRCHWYVSQRKHALVGVADTMQEFFTKAEARTFVKLARERLGIPDLRIAPAPATPPSKSFEDRMVERGEELHMVLVSEDENFGVTCFDEQWPPGKNSDITPTDAYHKAAVDRILDDANGVLHSRPWTSDDRQWFERNPQRAHRARMPFPGEVDEQAAETPAGDALIVLVRQVEPGSGIGVAFYLPADLLPLPDDEAVTHALFEVVMGREAVPPDRAALCALIEKYTMEPRQ